MKTRRLVLFLALITLIVFPLIGYMIFHSVRNERWLSFLDHGIAIYYQVLIGISYGAITAELGWRLIKTKMLEPSVEKYSKLAGQLNLNTIDVIFVSACAGIGEELLFRASIQPLLGIIVTSFLFVGMHGYLNPRDWRISIYGLYMTGVIAGIGWLYETTGIYTVMIAHTVIDIILLTRLKKS